MIDKLTNDENIISMSTSENPRILLVCIGFNLPQKRLSSLTIDDLFLMFHIFGKINKIIIFSQKFLLKAFIEYQKPSDAQKVVEVYHEKNLNNYGKIRIFPSPMKVLTFSNKFLTSKDFIDIDQTSYLKALQSKIDFMQSVVSKKTELVAKDGGVWNKNVCDKNNWDQVTVGKNEQTLMKEDKLAAINDNEDTKVHESQKIKYDPKNIVSLNLLIKHCHFKLFLLQIINSYIKNPKIILRPPPENRLTLPEMTNSGKTNSPNSLLLEPERPSPTPELKTF